MIVAEGGAERGEDGTNQVLQWGRNLIVAEGNAAGRG